MLFRTIRNVLSVGAALGFAHGGWESCSRVLTEIGSAATHPELAAPHQERAECSGAFLSAVGSRTRCIVRIPRVCCVAADTDVHEPALHACNGHPTGGGPTEVDAHMVEKGEARSRVPALFERAGQHAVTLPKRPEPLQGQERVEQIAREQAAFETLAAKRSANQQAARHRAASE